MVSIRDIINIVNEAGAPSPGFDETGFMRALGTILADLRAARNDKSAQGQARVQQANGAVMDKARDGLRQAGLQLQPAAVQAFTNRVSQLLSAVGLSLNGPSQSPDDALAGGGDPADRPTQQFPFGLAQFVRTQQSSDPAWRLVQMTSKVHGPKTYVAGLAEVGPQKYTLFFGNSVDGYRTQEVSLLDARRQMSRTLQNGFVEMPLPKASQPRPAQPRPGQPTAQPNAAPAASAQPAGVAAPR